MSNPLIRALMVLTFLVVAMIYMPLAILVFAAILPHNPLIAIAALVLSGYIPWRILKPSIIATPEQNAYLCEVDNDLRRKGE